MSSSSVISAYQAKTHFVHSLTLGTGLAFKWIVQNCLLKSRALNSRGDLALQRREAASHRFWCMEEHTLGTPRDTGGGGRSRPGKDLGVLQIEGAQIL